jgi:hypothetical protein
MVFTSIQPFPIRLTPITNITPLTYRDASTFLEELQQISAFLTQLVEDTNTALTNAETEFNAGIENAENTFHATRDDWEAKWQAFKDNVQLEIAVLNDAAVGDLILDEISETYTAVSALIDTLATTPAELAAALDPINTALGGKIPAAEKGEPNGVATLGPDGLVPGDQLPVPTPPVTTLAGNYAARPAANAHPNGTTYYAVDVAETYRTNGTAWTVVGNGGNELGFTTLDSSVPMFNTTSATYVDVPNVVLSITAGERPFSVAFDLWAANSVPGVVTYALFVDGVQQREFVFNLSSGDTWETATGEAPVRGLTPGNTYSVSLKVKTTTGTSRTSGEPRIWAVSK